MPSKLQHVLGLHKSLLLLPLWCILLIAPHATSAFLFRFPASATRKLRSSLPAALNVAHHTDPEMKRAVSPCAEFEQSIYDACQRRKGGEVLELLRRAPSGTFASKAEERAARNRAIKRLGAFGLWRDALRVFDEERRHKTADSTVAEINDETWSKVLPPDSYTWVSVLGVCANARPPQWQTALRLLGEIDEESQSGSVSPIMSSSSSLPSQQTIEGACDERLDQAQGQQHQQQSEQHAVCAVHVSLAMKACTKAGRPREVLELLRQHETLTGERPGLRLYNQAVDACARQGMLETVLDQVLPEMWSERLRPDTWTLNLALKACEVRGDVAAAKSLLNDMTNNRGVEKDVVTYNTALAVCASSSSSSFSPSSSSYVPATTATATTTAASTAEFALELYRELQSKAAQTCTNTDDNAAFTPSSAKASAMRAATTDQGSDDPGSGHRSPLRPDNCTYVSAMVAMGAAGKWQDALEVFHDTRRQGQGQADLRPNLRVFNAALEAVCATGGQSHLCVDILSALKEEEELCFPANATSRGDGSGFSSSGRSKGANNAKTPLTPDRFTWNLVMKAHALAGDPVKCAAVLADMKEQSLRPASSSSGGRTLRPKNRDYNVLIWAHEIKASNKRGENAFAAKGRGEEGRESLRAACVLNVLDEMEREGLTPDSYSFSTSIIACGRLDCPTTALSLVDRMEKSVLRTLTKTKRHGGGGGGNSGKPLYVYRAALSVCQHEQQQQQQQEGRDRQAQQAQLLAFAVAARAVLGKAKEFEKRVAAIATTADGVGAASAASSSVGSGGGMLGGAGHDGEHRDDDALAPPILAIDIGVGLEEYSMVLRCCERAGDWVGALEVMTDMKALATAPAPSAPASASIPAPSAVPPQAVTEATTTRSPGEGSPNVGGGGVRLRALELLADTIAKKVDDGERSDEEGLLEPTAASSSSLSPPPASSSSELFDLFAYEAERSRTFNTAVVVCAYGGQWATALSLVRMMESRYGAASVDQVAHSATIAALNTGGRFADAIKLFDRRVQEMLTGAELVGAPDAVACGAAMEAAASLGHWDKVLRVLRVAEFDLCLRPTPSMLTLAAQALRALSSQEVSSGSVVSGDSQKQQEQEQYWQLAVAFAKRATEPTATVAGASSADNATTLMSSTVGPTALSTSATANPPAPPPLPLVTPTQAIGRSGASNRLERVVVECACACVEAEEDAAALDLVSSLHRLPSPSDEALDELFACAGQYDGGDDGGVGDAGSYDNAGKSAEAAPSSTRVERRRTATTKFGETLYAMLLNDGRLKPCTSEVVAGTNAADEATQLLFSSSASLAAFSPSSLPPLPPRSSPSAWLVVDLASAPTDRQASLALAHELKRTCFSSSSSPSSDSPADNSSPVLLGAVVRTGGGTRHQEAVRMLQESQPPMLVAATSSSRPPSTFLRPVCAARVVEADEALHVKWQSGSQVFQDRVVVVFGTQLGMGQI